MALGTAASALGGPTAESGAVTESTKDVSRIRRFIDEAWSELKKVSWPTREQTRNLTVLVFAISLVIGIYITILDTVFQQAIGLLSQGGR